MTGVRQALVAAIGEHAGEEVAAALLPTVQRLIADAEKRAAAAALNAAADRHNVLGYHSVASYLRADARAALDPAGAASGETT